MTRGAIAPHSPDPANPSAAFTTQARCRDGERERMAAYRFGGLEGTLLRLGESGQMSMIG